MFDFVVILCRKQCFHVTIMARKKIREYDSKRLVKEHFKRISGTELAIKSAQVCRFGFVGFCFVTNLYSNRFRFCFC